MSTTKKKKKSARERRVLVASVICAGLIVAGSTFAWFTSTDEVTNRLSASAEYGVAIAESFQPPENWVPGQEINKDASAVNTGNVDAFVRMWLDGKMRLLQQNKSATATTTAQVMASSYTAPLTAVTDVNLVNLNMTYQDDAGNYFKTLDKTQTLNPKSSISTNNPGYAGNDTFDNTKTGPYSEVQAMQSGILAYAPSGAKYSYVLDEETELEVYLTSTVNGETTPSTDYRKVYVPAGTLVIAGDSSPKAATLNTDGTLKPDNTSVTITSTAGSTKAYTSTVYIKSQTTATGTHSFIPQNVEYESFTPMSKGLYLFLRNEEGVNQTNPEFSGYFMSGTPTSATDGTAYNAVDFFALNTNTAGTNRSDYTVKGQADGASVTFDKETPIKVTYSEGSTGTNAAHNITKVEPQEALELYTAKYTDVVANNLKWFYDDTTAGSEKIYAIYEGSETANNQFDGATDIAVEIDLANILTSSGTAGENWTAIGAASPTANYTLKSTQDLTKDASKLTFYYNNDLEAGDTTAKLVDKVKLYEGVTNNAYLAFDFDLNVHLESIQVTMDENGVEADTAVHGGWEATPTGTPENTKAYGTGTVDSGTTEIKSVTWTTTAPSNP